MPNSEWAKQLNATKEVAPEFVPKEHTQQNISSFMKAKISAEQKNEEGQEGSVWVFGGGVGQCLPSRGD